MKTLDEVIKALSYCNEGLCEDCPEHDDYGERCTDALICHAYHYLREYKVLRTEPNTAMTENPPLSWDELKGMNGKPVWIDDKGYEEWRLVHAQLDGDIWFVDDSGTINRYFYDEYGKTWKAYKEEPK